MISLMFVFLTFAFCIFLGVFTFIKNPAKKVNQLYSVFMFLTSIWIFANFAQNEQVGYRTASILLRLDFATASFIGFSFLYFCLNFPSPKKYNLLFILALLTPAGLLALSSFSGLVIRDFQFSIQSTSFKEGFLFIPYALYFIGCIIAGTTILIKKLKFSSASEKNQIFYTLAGISIPAFFALIINLILSQLIILPVFVSRFAIYGMLAGCAIISYAITKTKLMDISVVISKTLAYGITILLLLCLYLIFSLPYRIYISPQINLGFLLLTISYWIFVGFVFEKMRLRIQTTSDKLILRGKYDYYKALSDATSEVTKTLSMESILNTLHRVFYEIIEISSPQIHTWQDFTKPGIKSFP